MSDPFIGEVRMFAGNFAPEGWALCDGRMLSITGNEVLYALIGTTYGGDGVKTFALPDFRGRLPVHTDQNFPLGTTGGYETVALTTNEIPSHTHTPQVNSQLGESSNPSGAYWAANSYDSFAPHTTQTLVNMNLQAIDAVGGGQPHDNLMPSLTISFIIAMEGLFPQRN